MFATEIMEVKCVNKEEYDRVLEEYKAKGYDIVVRGCNFNGEWYFKCHK